jgi:hypothetical protein
VARPLENRLPQGDPGVPESGASVRGLGRNLRPTRLDARDGTASTESESAERRAVVQFFKYKRKFTKLGDTAKMLEEFERC